MRPEPAAALPLFGLVPAHDDGAVFLEHGGEILLPLFTSRAAVLAHLKNSGVRHCRVLEMRDAAALGAFLAGLPARGPNGGVPKVAIDLIDAGTRARVLTAAELVASLPRASPRRGRGRAAGATPAELGGGDDTR